MQPLAEVARRHIYRFAREAACYAELDLDRWFLDGDPFELLRMRRVAERIADLHVFDTRERQDVSGERFGDRHALECFEPYIALMRAGAFPPSLQTRHGRACLHAAPADPPNGEPTDIVIVHDVVDEHLKGRVDVAFWRRDALCDRHKERLEVDSWVSRSTEAVPSLPTA